MASASAGRARTAAAFDGVRRRAAVAQACRVVSHGALGAVFGALLALTGDATPWLIAALAAAGAGGAAAWVAVRLPRVDAGRLIERRFPECRNVLITADEVLGGTLDVTDAAAERVFTRATETLDRIDARRAVGLAGPVAVAGVTVVSAAAAVVYICRHAFRV